MDEWLMDVIEAGNIDGLYALLRQNPFILEEIDQIPFIETPLHIAVLADQTDFAAEIANLKPSFARKLNPDGFSPLHLASAKGNVEMVKELLKVDLDLCLLKGREKRTPLHCAAFSGNVEVLRELLSACPMAIRESTVRGETALHLAVKNGKFDAFNVIVQNLKQHLEENVLNWKDNQGNTALHLAVLTRQRQAVELLLSTKILYGMAPAVKVNVMNKNNLTALDILLQSPREASDFETEIILRRVGAMTSNDVLSLSPIYITLSRFLKAFLNYISFRQSHTLRRWRNFVGFEKRKESPSEVRNALLVVFVLIATATFQIGTNPPSTVWQHDTATSEKPQTFGPAVLLYSFILFNLVGFSLSSFVIFFITHGLPLRRSVILSLLSMVVTYLTSLQLIVPNIVIVVLVFLAFIGSIVVIAIITKERMKW